MSMGFKAFAGTLDTWGISNGFVLLVLAWGKNLTRLVEDFMFLYFSL